MVGVWFLLVGSVLVVVAHPDDEAGGVGTILKCVRLGVEVTLVWLTWGCRGRPAPVLTGEEVAGVREAEARRVASILGVSPVFGGLSDCGVSNDSSSRDRLIRVFREVRPEVVLTHSPFERHPDHRATHKLVVDVSWLVSIGSVGGGTCPCSPPSVYCLDSGVRLDGRGGCCPFMVDVSGWMEEAASCLLEYKSQVGERLRRACLDAARCRGREIGVQYAESFLPMWHIFAGKGVFPELGC